jgi:hypothetical protein
MGADFRKRTLLDRKAALLRVLPANRRVRYARHFNDSSAQALYIEITTLCGSGFDTDRQYRIFGEILRASGLSNGSCRTTVRTVS